MSDDIEKDIEKAPEPEDEGPKTMNRWLVVVGAILIQLALGAIYSWSVFTGPLKDEFRFSATETQMIFSAGLLTFALVMVLSGRLLTKHQPRKIAMYGGLLLGAGYLAASAMGGSVIGLLVCIGIVGGAGIGMAYVVPIAVGMKWFPDKKEDGSGWDENDISAALRADIKNKADKSDISLSVHAPWYANPLNDQNKSLIMGNIAFAGDIGANLLNIHLYAASLSFPN